MIFDKTLMFSDRQSVTTNTVSTHVVDLGPVANGVTRDIGKGASIPILVQVVESYVGQGMVTVACETSDVEDFSSGVVVVWSSSAMAGFLKAGYVFVPEQMQRGTAKRYMRLKYTVSGTLTGGKLVAGITMGNQSNG